MSAFALVRREQGSTIQNTLYKIKHKFYVSYIIHEAQNLYYLYYFRVDAPIHIHSYVCIDGQYIIM
jgi:hypothetical protein